jgi:hypothetical protein
MAKVIPEEGVRFTNPDNLESQVREYLKVKATLEQMESRSRELREALFSKIDEEGYEDDKGNVTLELDGAIDEVVRIEKQRRVTRKLDEQIAEDLIEERGIGDAVYKTIRVIDEDALMAQMYEGKISEDDIDRMFPSKVVWALMTKKK